MFVVFESLLDIVIVVTSIYLIISGYSTKEKYSSLEYIRKRNLILGIILLLLFFLAGLPDMYHSFIKGFEAGSKGI